MPDVLCVFFGTCQNNTNIICEELTWQYIISTWSVNCINLFSRKKKSGSDGQKGCALVERICEWFYQFFALKEKNQTQFELSSEAFDVM